MAPPENREIGIDGENSDDDSLEVVNLASGSLHKSKSKSVTKTQLVKTVPKASDVWMAEKKGQAEKRIDGVDKPRLTTQ